MSQRDEGSERDRLAARRRVLKSGLIAVPLILSVRARPLHAQTAGGSLGTYGYGDPMPDDDAIGGTRPMPGSGPVDLRENDPDRGPNDRRP